MVGEVITFKWVTVAQEKDIYLAWQQSLSLALSLSACSEGCM